jgi:hypothetical protein
MTFFCIDLDALKRSSHRRKKNDAGGGKSISTGARDLNSSSSSPPFLMMMLNDRSVFFLIHFKKFSRMSGAPVLELSWQINNTELFPESLAIFRFTL